MSREVTVETLYPYTPIYQEKCFEVWYTKGRPTYTKLIDDLPEDERGRKPSVSVFKAWRSELSWDIRADELDARVSAVTDEALVNSRILMVREQAAKARELQQLGMDFLREEGFDSSAAAVSAIIKGADLERVSRGLSEHLVKLSKMDDAALTAEVNRLLEKENATPEIVDVEEAPEQEEDSEE